MQGGFGGGFGHDPNNNNGNMNGGFAANAGGYPQHPPQYPPAYGGGGQQGYPQQQQQQGMTNMGINSNMNTNAYGNMNGNNPLQNSNYNSNNNAPQSNNGGGGGGGLGSAFGGGFGGDVAQSMLMDIGKQNLQQYMKVGEQSFLTNYLPFVRDLRQYFRVDHQYVRRKVALLFAPFLQSKIAKGSALNDGAAIFSGGSIISHQRGMSASSNAPSLIRSASATMGGATNNGGVNSQFNFGDDSGFGNTMNPTNNSMAQSGSPAPQVLANGLMSPNSPQQQQQQSGVLKFKMPAPVDDVLAPDLYIPSMALLTYVALCGFIRGLTSQTLAPEFLAAMLWSLILWEAFEVIIVMIASYALMTPLSTLDALSLAGYKHVGVCFLLLFRELLSLQQSYIYLIPVFYVAGCSVLFAYNTIKMFISRRGDGSVHVRSMPLLYGWAGVQALFVFWFAMKPF